MSQTVTAVYEGGVLRPTTPLALAEGETVELTVTQPKPPAPPLTEEEALRRIREAKTLEELFAANDAAAQFDPDDGYDFHEAMNENRRSSGADRLLYPPELKGISW
jgi:predicted DNA-binding antitoxin AbrB/MazE fold protein